METAADQSPASMKLALVHFAAAHKKPQQNLAQLVSLNRQAAEAGASLILNTEMAVSGYSFKTRQDISPYTETDQGRTVCAMGGVAADHKVYIGIAFAERDPATDIYYNAAVLLGPDGRIIAKYRKVLAERRWARSGSPAQQAVADTPWGRIGIAICADSYSGLITRTIALKSVDLLWVPANWPVAGGLDPMTVWRARVLENGFYLAACNRTGKDLTMDCTQAVSCVLDPTGRAVFAGAHETSRVFLADIPLDSDGKWADVQRDSKMQKRELAYYRPIYLQPWMEDFTGFHHLPEPGLLHIHCLVPEEEGLTSETLASQIEGLTEKRPALWVLPTIADNVVDETQLAAIAEQYQVAIATVFSSSTGLLRRMLITADGVQPFMVDTADAKASDDAFPFKILHIGPAAVAMAPVDAFAHPELAVALSKLGSDLVVVSDAAISDDGFLLSRIKALAGVAVVASSSRGVQITGVHDHHFNWEHETLDHPGVLSYVLDTAKTRKKMFHENIDFDLLLTKP
jgi:predicted amidohydrolase